MSDEIDDLVDAITEIPFRIPVSEFELSRFDEDGEPYGELCWCTETDGEGH